MDDRSLKAQLRQANALGLSQTVIISEEEVRTGSMILRDILRGEQTQLPLEKAILQLTKTEHKTASVRNSGRDVSQSLTLPLRREGDLTVMYCSNNILRIIRSILYINDTYGGIK